MSKFSNFLERLGIKTNNSVQLPNAGTQRKLNSNNTSGTRGLSKRTINGKSYWRAVYAHKDLYTGVSREIAIARLDKARSI